MAGLQEVLLGSAAPPADLPVQLGLPAAKPVGAGATLNYTLRVRNLGADTAAGVTAAAVAHDALQLTGNATVSVGRFRRAKSAASRSARP